MHPRDPRLLTGKIMEDLGLAGTHSLIIDRLKLVVNRSGRLRPLRFKVIGGMPSRPTERGFHLMEVRIHC